MRALLPKVVLNSAESIVGIVLATLLIAFAGWIYFPGTAGPALLDDYSNIAVIPDLTGSPELALDYVLGNGSGPLGRPVSMATFVLESLFSERNIATSKQINIGLHLFNGCLVIWLFTLLLRHIQVPGAFILAILLGTAWLVSPLFVSTVLYVVQRMAMLAATFMLLAMIVYCHWRIAVISGKRHFGLVLALGLFFLLAIYSKENAIVLVPLLLLLEVLWFEFKGANGQVLASAKYSVFGAIALGGLAIGFLLVFGSKWYAAGYVSRYFTLPERLMTEARILWDYVGQIYVPEVLRMGIYHDDVVVSTSLLEPIATLYSIIAWALVVLVCLLLLHWRYGRFLVFAIACFLVGHGAESTIFPLELYFEHRNYFPAIGLFLGIGVLYAGLVKLWPEIKVPLLVYLGFYVLLIASQTSSQVQVWSNPTLRILNNLNAHPRSSRANADMAILMVQQGDLEAARAYSARTFSVSHSERSGDYAIRELALICAVNGAFDENILSKLVVESSARPLSSVDTLLTLVRMLQDNVCPNFDRIAFADQMAVIFLQSGYPSKGASNIYASLAVLENALGRYSNAYDYTEKFLILSPESSRGLLMKLHFATALGKTEIVDRVTIQLRKMVDEGRLTVGEQQTLALYLESG